jgi:aspartate carbamoyltransferase catalytic subunit
MTFGINEATLRYAKLDAIVMHPGPMNRGLEIGGDLPDGHQSVVCQQVTSGVAVRMAALYLLLGADGIEG